MDQLLGVLASLVPQPFSLYGQSVTNLTVFHKFFNLFCEVWPLKVLSDSACYSCDSLMRLVSKENYLFLPTWVRYESTSVIDQVTTPSGNFISLFVENRVFVPTFLGPVV